MEILLIDEEFGYRTWIAELTDEEWVDLQRKWLTIRRLSCLVPVPLIVPQAVEHVWHHDMSPDEIRAWRGRIDSATKHADIHEMDDSHLNGVSCVDASDERPDYEASFEMDGKSYSYLDLMAISSQYRQQDSAEYQLET